MLFSTTFSECLIGDLGGDNSSGLAPWELQEGQRDRELQLERADPAGPKTHESSKRAG